MMGANRVAEFATAGANALGVTDATAEIDQRHYYRARSVNSVGVSRYSNVASAIRRDPVVAVGGVLPFTVVHALRSKLLKSSQTT